MTPDAYLLVAPLAAGTGVKYLMTLHNRNTIKFDLLNQVILGFITLKKYKVQPESNFDRYGFQVRIESDTVFLAAYTG